MILVLLRLHYWKALRQAGIISQPQHYTRYAMTQDDLPQRLRITYCKSAKLRYIGHLDLMRAWERALRRAKLPLVYTQGFTPHARIALGAPLAVGTVGERELLDVWMFPSVTPEVLVRRISTELPEGLDLIGAEEVPYKLPSLQSQISGATYKVFFISETIDVDAVRSQIVNLLALDALDWEEQRGAKVKRYDLRATIRTLALSECEQQVMLDMDLELNEERTGRPSSILAALKVQAQPKSVVRTRLELS